MKGYRTEFGHSAVVAASERLDYAGMQARFQLATKDQIVVLLQKELALGLQTKDLALGLAGYVTTIITTLAMRADQGNRKAFALRIGAEVMSMIQATDWGDETNGGKQ